VKITVLSDDDFLSNTKLHEDIIKLAEPTYEDATVVLTSALSNFDTVYLAYNDAGNLVAFYMAGFEDLIVGDKVVPSIHLGWTCSAQESKGSGAAQLTYERFTRDGLSRQNAKGIEFLLWGTTATPIGLHLYQKHFVEVLPNPDGSYPESSVEIAEALRKRLAAPEASDHPFVLKRCHNARFSQRELRRIETINQESGFSLLENLGIDERQGDRLLVTCRFRRQ